MIVSRSEAALRDVEGLWFYVAQESLNAADRLIERIDAAFRNLIEFPRMGIARPDLAAELRALRVDNLIVFYRVGSDEISIERVLHSRMDATQVDF